MRYQARKKERRGNRANGEGRFFPFFPEEGGQATKKRRGPLRRRRNWEDRKVPPLKRGYTLKRKRS